MARFKALATIAKHRVFDANHEKRNHVRVRYSNGKPYKWDVMWMTMTFHMPRHLDGAELVIVPPDGLTSIPPIIGTITDWPL